MARLGGSTGSPLYGAIEMQTFSQNDELSSPFLPAPAQPRPPLITPTLNAPVAPRTAQWDSFSYGDWHSVAYDLFMASKHRWHFRKVTALRWSVNFLIGALIALIAVGITFSSHSLTFLKFQAMDILISVDKEKNLYALTAFLGLLCISLSYAMVAAFLVAFVEPVAGGSGIPEIKAILNGVKLPRVLRLKTLVCKAVGIAFSVASGLPVGKEGPCIHCGSCVAAALTQGRPEHGSRGWSLIGFLTCDAIPRSALRNDKEKSEFISWYGTVVFI